MNRDMILAAAVAAGLHVGLLGFKAAPRPLPPADKSEPIEWRVTAPPFEEDPPPAADSVANDDPLPPPSPAAPRSAEIPSSVPDITREHIVVTPSSYVPGDSITIIPRPIGGGTGAGEVVIDGIYLDYTPRVLFRTAPNRPLGADSERETITVEFIVGKNGSVVTARVVESSNSRYDDVCLNAVKRWRFEPGMRKNVPVPFRMQQTFVFTTRD